MIELYRKFCIDIISFIQIYNISNETESDEVYFFIISLASRNAIDKLSPFSSIDGVND